MDYINLKMTGIKRKRSAEGSRKHAKKRKDLEKLDWKKRKERKS